MGGGLEPKKWCTQSSPNPYFLLVKFVFSHCEIWVRCGGGGGAKWTKFSLGRLWCP